VHVVRRTVGVASVLGWRPTMGATLTPEGVRFRVWAPLVGRVELELGDEPRGFIPMEAEEDGAWTLMLPDGRAGIRYKYRLDGGEEFPDPYSRSQPDGVHGPSEVVDPEAHPWHDQEWGGLDIRGLVVYECHVGTATPEGTFESLVGQLDRLRRLGVTALQIMPVAEFSGRRNWGYDGVYPFAPSRNYGGGAGLKRLVDAAHQHGLGVILDVVYNHLGPEGNYFQRFSPYYFTDRYSTPWGPALNFDGPHSQWVRKLVLDNALYWIHEYRVDGLRLDATHAIHDNSRPHILQELARNVRQSLPPGRKVVLIAETSENDVRYLLPAEAGGHRLDAVWADDFHHSLRRYLAGDDQAYYQDYAGTLDEVARIMEQGFLYEGQRSRARGAPRGTPARAQPAWQFQFCLQNHDQVGNRALGDRLRHALDLDRYRVASALLLLLPYTPLVFMGQEFAASSPFQYFTDHSPDLGRLVTEGRREEFRGFAAFSDPGTRDQIPDPQAEQTFVRSRLPLAEAREGPGAQVHRLYEEVLRLRREDPVLRRQNRHALRARAVTKDLLAVRSWDGSAQRLLLANFGPSVAVSMAQESGGGGGRWRVILDTGEQRFGGPGIPARFAGDRLVVPERTAVVLAAESVEQGAH
jgi:maltooligosyltrehalose trehalohydrolase